MKVMYGHGVNHGLLGTCMSAVTLHWFIKINISWLTTCCLAALSMMSNSLYPAYINSIYCYRKQISTPVRVQGLEKVKLIAVGAFHNLALLEDGSLLAWGNNEYGQLGTGDTQPRSQPIPVHGLSDLNLVSIFLLFQKLYVY